MDIQSLLCSYQNNTTGDMYIMPDECNPLSHQCLPSWTSSACSSSLSSPSTTSTSPHPYYYSTPSSPETERVSAPTVNNSSESATHYNRHSQIRIPWSSKEDQLLQQGVSQGLSWAMISTVYLPHRSRGCCWGRFKTLQSKYVEQKEWSEAEDHQLLWAIKKNSRLFKQAWKMVSQDVNNRTWKECEARAVKANQNTMIKKKYRHLDY